MLISQFLFTFELYPLSSEQHVAWRQNFHFRLSYSLKKIIYCWLNGTVTTMQMWFCCISDVILFHLVQKVFTFPLFLFSEAVEYIVQRITLESLATHAAKYNSIKLNHNISCFSFFFFLCLWLESSLSSRSRLFENWICGLVWQNGISLRLWWGHVDTMAVAVMPFTIRLATSEAMCRITISLSGIEGLCYLQWWSTERCRWPEGRENQGLEKINYRVLQNILLSFSHFLQVSSLHYVCICFAFFSQHGELVLLVLFISRMCTTDDLALF